MKRLISIIISLFIFQIFYAQKYIMLDEISNKYEVKKYTLNTLGMYKIDKEIEMYNVYIQDTKLLLISVLPDLENDKDWQELGTEEVSSKIYPIDKILSGDDSSLDFEDKTKVFNKVFLIKKENGKLYAAKNCLLETFVIMSYPSILHISGKNIINIEQDIVHYSDIREIGYSRYSMEDMGIRFQDCLKFIYMSAIEEKDNEKVYRFWTFDDWHNYVYHQSEQGYNWHRGIDRFAYIPKKGIVGGSYDFYFDLVKNPYFKRTVGREIMWAKELF